MRLIEIEEFPNGFLFRTYNEEGEPENADVVSGGRRAENIRDLVAILFEYDLQSRHHGGLSVAVEPNGWDAVP